MVYILANSLALVVAAIAAWSAGFAIERGLLADRLPADLRNLARFCLGIGFWIASAFALACLGALNVVSVGLLGLAVAVAALVLARVVPSVARIAPVVAGAAPAGAWWRNALFATVLAPLFVLAMSPEVSWDADTYHLTLPRLFAAHGGFRPVEMNVYSNWPLNVELLFTLAIVVRDHVAARLLHFGFGLLTLYAMHVACRGFGLPRAGWLAAALFLANQVVLFELTVAYVDLAYAFFFVSAFCFVVRSRENPRAPLDDPQPAARDPASTACLALAGISAGLMSGVKVGGIVGAAILGVLLLPDLYGAAGRLGVEARRVGVAFVLPVVLLSAPWLLKAWWYTGNPFYPMAYSVFGGPDWSSTLTRQLEVWQHAIGMGRAPLDYLLLPVRMFLHGGDDYAHFSGAVGSFWLVAIPFSLAFVRRSAPARRSLLVAGLWFVFWAATSQQMRLFLPALPLLAMASAAELHAVIERAAVPARVRTAAGVAAFAIGLLLVPLNGLRGYNAGLRAPRRFLASTIDPRAAAVPEVFRFIGARLPADARILFVNTNHGFFCPREYVADSFFEASQIAAWLAPARTTEDVRRLLGERRITHLLVGGHDWGIDYPKAFQAYLRDPRELKLLYRAPARSGQVYSLFSVTDGSEDESEE